MEFFFATNSLWQVWDDVGSDADEEGSFWSHYSENDYYALGDLACSGHGNCGDMMVVKDISDNGDALKQPTGSKKIWCDHGSGADHDVCVYELIPFEGYSCLGDVAVGSYRRPPFLANYRCVKNEYVIDNQYGQ